MNTRWIGLAFGGLLVATASPAAPIGPIVVVQATSPNDSDDWKQITAPCPPGLIAFGGGASVTPGVSLVLHQSLPQFDPPSGWLALAQERSSTGANWAVTSWALCAEVSAYTLVSESSPFNSLDKTIQADCPPGEVPIGGGAGIFVFGPKLALARVAPTVTGWEAEAFEAFPVSANWFLNVKVICAPATGVERFEATTSTTGAFFDTIGLVCSPGRVTLGGGAWSDVQGAMILGTRPRTSIQGAIVAWEVTGWQASPEPWELHGVTLCLSVQPLIFADGFE